MANGLVLMSYCNLLQPYPYLTKMMAPHSFVTLDKLPEKRYYSSSYFPQTVHAWNNLDHQVAAAFTLDLFKEAVWKLHV